MRYITRYISLICIITLGMPVLSEAFDTQLTQEQMKEASEYGSKYRGKEVFDSPIVKKACFGEYPHGEGGIVMSKYINAAVTSAMVALKDKTLSPEDLKEIAESATFKVAVSVPAEKVGVPEDVQIILIQGTNNILPQKTEFGVKYKERQGVIGTFQSDKVDPRANTTIVAKMKNDSRKYTIDFSDVK